MELSLGNILTCPAGTPGRDPITIEMHEIYRLEARQPEVAHVNKVTAPDLMQAMIDGYGRSGRAHMQLEWELKQAYQAAEERKAIVYLEIAPQYFKDHGLVRTSNPSGSEDMRRAVLARDAEYKKLSDRVAMIEAAVEFLKLKMKSFEQSYMSVKKVYDSLSSVNALSNGINRPQSASTYTSEDEQKIIGKPHYG